MDQDTSLEPMTNLSQLLPSQVNHYMTVNGRFLVHLLVQLYLNFLGKGVTVVTGAFLGALLIYLMGKFIPLHKSPIKSCIALLFSLLVIMPCYSIGSWFGGPIGIFNYLMPSTIMLGTLYLFRKYNNEIPTQQSNHSVMPLVLLFFAGLLMGATMETFTVPVSGAMFLYSIFHIKSIKRKAIALMLGFWLGTLTLLVSPGSWSRLGDSMSIITMLKVRIFGFITLEKAFIIPIILFIVLLILIITKKEYRIKVKDFLNKNQLLIFVAAVNIMFQFAAGLFQFTRIFQPLGIVTTIFISFIIIKLLSHFSATYNKIAYSLLAIFNVIVCVLCVNVAFARKSVFIEFVNKYIDSADGCIVLNNKMPSSSSTYSITPYGLSFPFPWLINVGADWERKSISYYYSKNTKPVKFSPDMSKINDKDIIFQNDSVTVKTRADSWWIIVEGLTGPEYSYCIGEGHRRHFPFNVLQKFSKAFDGDKSLMTSRIIDEGKYVSVISKRLDYSMESLDICRDSTLTVITIPIKL